MFTPDFCGGAALFTDLAVGLQHRGHEVTVYTTFPYYPEWKNKDDGAWYKKRVEELQGVRVVRHGIFIPSRPSKLIPRLLFEISFAVSLMRSLFSLPRQDAVIVLCPLFGATLFGAVRGLLRREPLWLNVQDIPTDASLAAGIVKRGLFSRAAETVQRIVFSRFQLWTSINEAMVKRLSSIGSPRIGPEMCANWLTGSLAEHIDSVIQSHDKQPMRSPLQLLYSGNIGKKQGLLEFCQILQTTKLPFQFTINGDGAAAGELWNWMSSVNDPRFVRGGFLEEREFAEAIRSADWFVITEKQDAGFSFIPSKLIPAMSLATPILAVSDAGSPLGREVREHELGLHCAWQLLSDLEPRLEKVSSDVDEQRRLQANCEKRATDYSKSAALDRYEALLNVLVKPH